ncbi:hypothetical protein BC834DRAFT_225257 [Gloeopeniophorella convolvens]|nr:hypothetical protein BC834DRAFT_225257 [Gloeopeniophorella convolvens]
MVTCVAAIVDIREHATSRVYYLEDGSAGRIHTYVRVLGTLKSWNGVNQLQATSIRPIADPLEPFFHCLEAMVAFISKGGPTHTQPMTSPAVSSRAYTSLPDTQNEQSASSEDNSESEDSVSVIDISEDSGRVDVLSRQLDNITFAGRHPSDIPNSSPDSASLPAHVPRSSPPGQPSPSPASSMRGQLLIQDPYSYLSPLQRAIGCRKVSDALTPRK